MDIVLASSNAGKIAEITQLLANTPHKLIAQAELGVNDAAETGTTFVENAVIKARHAAQCTGLPAIADDSGLTVDALQGAPGVFSARYAGEQANDSDRINKLLTELAASGQATRTACYHCLIVLMWNAHEPAPLICHGAWAGEILTAPRGTQGFGYDPIFYLPTRACSAAELSVTEKNTISHRAQALHQLQKALAD